MNTILLDKSFNTVLIARVPPFMRQLLRTKGKQLFHTLCSFFLHPVLCQPLSFFFVGKGKKVSFVLNQDFHDGYDNENSAAYNILANNVKKEVSWKQMLARDSMKV